MKNIKEFDLFGFQVQIDEVATREWYEKANEWNCECEDCRHFIDLVKKKELPIPVLEALEQLGIVPEKATYVCEMITEEHKVLYQFSYRMAEKLNLRIKEDNILLPIIPGFGIYVMIQRIFYWIPFVDFMRKIFLFQNYQILLLTT